MAGGIDERAARPFGGKAKRVVEVAVASEAGEDRQARRVGRGPGRRPERVRAQVPDRAGPRSPTRPGLLRAAELVEAAARLVDDQDVVVRAAFDLRVRRDRIRALVALVGVL